MNKMYTHIHIKSIWVPRFITENFTEVAWQPRNVSTLRKSIERLFLDQDGGKVPPKITMETGENWGDTNLEGLQYL